MKKTIFTGSAVALVTPFNQKGEVDYEKLSELLEFHIKNKTDAIVICATTGENATMPDEEHKAVLKYAVEVVNHRIPVIAGTGSNDTAHAVAFSQCAEKYGCDAVLCVTPYYNKTSQRGLVEHYKKIAESITLPIIVYHIPGRTCVTIKLDTFKRLAEIPNIVAVKEATGDIALAAKIAANTDLTLYAGNDDIIVPMMSVGGKGVISVVANILPEKTHNICMDYLNGDTDKSRSEFLGMLNLIEKLFIDVNPIPVKVAMNMLGYNVGGVRLPLYDMCDEDKAVLKNALVNYGLNLK